ncbi:hypothetical protein [Streptomyces sp. NPDC055400]
MINQQERLCGRPTRAGNPCRIQVSGSDVACGTHATEKDKAIAEAHRRGWNEGYKSGSESAASFSASRIERSERRVKELEEQLDDAQRVYEVGATR